MLFHSFVTIPHYVLYIIIYCFRVISRQAKYRAYFTLLGSGQPRVHPSALFNFNLLLSIVLFIMSIYLKLTGVFGWHNLRKGSSSPGGVEEPRAPRPTTVLTCTIWERWRVPGDKGGRGEGSHRLPRQLLQRHQHIDYFMILSFLNILNYFTVFYIFNPKIIACK